MQFKKLNLVFTKKTAMKYVLFIIVSVVLMLGNATVVGNQFVDNTDVVSKWHAKVIRKYALLEAVMYVETRNGKVMTSKTSKREGAVGIIQIREGMIPCINRWYGTHFVQQDRLDSAKCATIFFLYQKMFNPDMDVELGAHIWNAGFNNVQQRWRLTAKYRMKVLRYLRKNELKGLYMARSHSQN